MASMCSPAVRWRHVVGDDDDEEEVCSYGLGYGPLPKRNTGAVLC